jgi:hypothetical protein
MREWGKSSAPEEGVDVVIVEGRPGPFYIGWRALGYKSVSIYPSWLQHGKLIRAGLSCLVHQVSSCLRPTCQVGRSSGRSGPLVGDG